MVSFRGQITPEPRPDWSPLGFNSNFPTSIPISFIWESPTPPGSVYLEFINSSWEPQTPYKIKLQRFSVKWDLTAYLYSYTIHLVSTAYFILGLFIRCSDKQTNILLDINCVTITSSSTITQLDWKQPSVSRGRSLPFYRIAPCLRNLPTNTTIFLGGSSLRQDVYVEKADLSKGYQNPKRKLGGNRAFFRDNWA